MTNEELLQQAKDQVAKETWDDGLNRFFNDWDDFINNNPWSTHRQFHLLNKAALQAIQSAREEGRKDGYKDGYRMGWDNRGLPEFLNPMITPYKENEYPIGGYAPGSYMCKCTTCGCEFFGDKRAFQCLPCASGMSSAVLRPIKKKLTAPGR